jgi:hypothetical protein
MGVHVCIKIYFSKRRLTVLGLFVLQPVAVHIILDAACYILDITVSLFVISCKCVHRFLHVCIFTQTDNTHVTAANTW